MKLFNYFLFALIAMAVNLVTQYGVFGIYQGPASLYVGIASGTVTGLISKYVLDKKFVFNHTSIDHREEVKSFSLYSIFGVFTTLIFWMSEIAFDKYIAHPNAKYLGALIGLGIGYTIKYFLDSKYVFNDKPPSRRQFSQ